MDPALNPYAPGAGTPPPELTGRGPLLENARIALTRTRNGLPTKSFILVGLRGVGKTVLLNRVDDQAREGGFHTALIEAHEEKSLPALLLPELRRILLGLDRGTQIEAAVKRGLRVLKSFAQGLRVNLAGLMQLEAEQRGEMASTLQRRKTEAYPEGMATGESH